MTASGLSGSQCPYRPPRAQMSTVAGGLGTAIRGFWGWIRERGTGAAGVWRSAADGGAGTDAAGRGGAGRCGGGPTRCSASRAGSGTARGATRTSARGDGGTAGAEAVGLTGAGARWTVTQPETVETAAMTRSVAVVSVRCTHATLLAPVCLWGADGAVSPRTGDVTCSMLTPGGETTPPAQRRREQLPPSRAHFSRARHRCVEGTRDARGHESVRPRHERQHNAAQDPPNPPPSAAR